VRVKQCLLPYDRANHEVLEAGLAREFARSLQADRKRLELTRQEARMRLAEIRAKGEVLPNARSRRQRP
jgi:hypothetical protein